MTLNHWIAGSIPIRCLPKYQRLRRFLNSGGRGPLGHFLDTCFRLRGCELYRRQIVTQRLPFLHPRGSLDRIRQKRLFRRLPLVTVRMESGTGACLRTIYG